MQECLDASGRFHVFSLLPNVKAPSISPTRSTASKVESRFFEPPGEKEIGSNYRGVGKIGGKITVFDWGREASFGSNYREFSETGMRVREIRILLY